MTLNEVFPKWTPREVARHYGWPDGPDGAGQTLAVINLGEVIQLDELKIDFEELGLPMPDIKIIDLNGGAAPPKLDPAGIETHIDVEVIGSLCPKAAIRVYRCKFSFAAMAEGIARAVKDDVDVISISWGAREDALSSGDIAAIERALKAARKAGITVCCASGDAGASGRVDPESHLPVPDAEGALHCIYPASSPHVLACGGTELIKTGETLREIAWNNTAAKGRATGGGVSKQFPVPEWQKGLEICSKNRGAGPGRIVPDVAAVAAVTAWMFFDRGGTKDPEGGTSAVAPFYAALVAVANQSRRAAGKARLGFVNDRIYQLAKTGAVFTDISEGDNAVAPDGLGYEAREGFDACTGWGTPKVAALLDALLALP